MKTIRCAVYTRKSNEEGLGMAFNSLDAQREAGLDYVKSQKARGLAGLEDRVQRRRLFWRHNEAAWAEPVAGGYR